MRRISVKRACAALAGVAVLATAPAAVAMSSYRLLPDGYPQHAVGHELVAEIRDATARFHDIAAAEQAGYVLFRDVDGIACIEDTDMGMGAMGVHYVNPALIADPAIDPTAPEALVYAPERDGTLRLAALEYLVDSKTWDARHHARPSLFKGRPFDATAAPNRYGLPSFYSQHVWAWKPNPAGLLAMWNHQVHCAWA